MNRSAKRNIADRLRAIQLSQSEKSRERWNSKIHGSRYRPKGLETESKEEGKETSAHKFPKGKKRDPELFVDRWTATLTDESFFSDEKYFLMDQPLNRQKDCLHQRRDKEAPE